MKIALQIKANLTNVDSIYPENPEELLWPIKVKCNGCGEENPSWHLISKAETIDATLVKVNFSYKCKCCKNENYLVILPDNQVSAKQKGSNAGLICKEYSSDDDGQFRTLLVLECRGLEVTEFEPRGGWAVRAGRKRFSDVDLTEKEWCEYNDLDDVPVEINNVETNLVPIK